MVSLDRLPGEWRQLVGVGVLHSKAVLHGIRDNRSADVIEEVMDKLSAEVWVSDC
jgi:hypothetical protein